MATIERLLPAKLKEGVQTLITTSPSPELARNQLSRLIEDCGVASLKKFPPAELPALVRLLGSSVYLSDVLLAQGKQWPEVFLRQLAISEKCANDHLKELQA